MKKALLLLSAVASLSFGAAASAGVVEEFNLGSWTLEGGRTVTWTFELQDNPNGVTGFQVEFDYDEPVGDASWASDAQVTLTSPSGASYQVGGFDTVDDADAEWSFQGSDSDLPGHYGDDDIFMPWAEDPEPKGIWTFSLMNDWAGDPNPNEYNNIVLRIYKVPAPGALALLGLAGLSSSRRRRRA